MRDPFPVPPPQRLVNLTKPLSTVLGLQTLPLHTHEVAFAFLLYTFICTVLSPYLSNSLVPHKYKALSKRTKINWDVHVVSFFQSVIICGISLYIILFDQTRKEWRHAGRWEERIWGYSGLSGLCQSFALGYFLWDLVICSWRVDIFGWGMLAHAISAMSVFALGYRPFLYFYAPVFLLYELSSPFLNVHWFCDKVDLTGSIYQAINGALLTATFFSCRIVWGLYSSYKTFYDMYVAIQAGHSQRPAVSQPPSVDVSVVHDEHGQITAFMGTEYLPLWLALTYFLSNVVLNVLNIVWFGKMIATIRKRFDPPWGTKGIGPDVVHYEPPENEKYSHRYARQQRLQKEADVRNAQKAEEMMMNGGVPPAPDEAAAVQRGVYADGHKSVEVTGSTRRSARSRRKA